jgi:hypothetical protein
MLRRRALPLAALLIVLLGIAPPTGAQSALPEPVNVNGPDGPTSNALTGGLSYGAGFAVCAPDRVDVTMPSADDAEYVAYEDWLYYSADGQTYYPWYSSGWFYRYLAPDIWNQGIDPSLRDWHAPDGSLGNAWSAPLPPDYSYLVRQHIYWYATADSDAHEVWVWAVAVPVDVGFGGTAEQAAGCRGG